MRVRMGEGDLMEWERGWEREGVWKGEGGLIGMATRVG